MDDDVVEQLLAMPHSLTASCCDCLGEYIACRSLVSHVLTMAEIADRLAVALADERAGASGTSHGPDKTSSFGYLTEVHLPVLAEMLLGKGVDNFLTYLAQLLAAIYEARPELAGGDAAPPAEAARQQVLRQTAAGFAALCAQWQAALGLDLFPDEKWRQRAVLIVESRRLLAEHRGIVHAEFLAQTAAAGDLGQRQEIDLVTAARWIRFLMAAALKIDQQAQQQFGLEAEPHTEWDQQLVAQTEAGLPRIDEEVECECCRGKDQRGRGSEDQSAAQ